MASSNKCFEMLSYLNVFLSKQLSQRLRALEVLPLPTECFFTGVELVTKIFELPLLQKLALALLKLCLFLSALLKDGLMTKSTLACQGLCVSCPFVLIILQPQDTVKAEQTLTTCFFGRPERKGTNISSGHGTAQKNLLLLPSIVALIFKEAMYKDNRFYINFSFLDGKILGKLTGGNFLLVFKFESCLQNLV